jgi:Rap guanine nucleotide exchange factor 1
MTPSRRSRRIGYLLDFKSQDLAEQMTLMDAELLSRIELTELLSWTKEQSEDAGLNLSQFTEHFNKVSFWARTRILEQTDQRDREKYFCKFMKIMRCLRKVQNLNSYLAILSAVDSAPVRRLSHSKTHLEALKDLGELIDSSQSFRAYRLVLAQMEPPCIPYIGIALQDLTFVNENPDWLDEAKTVVNFGKRWQQYHILSHLARLQKTCQFTFQRNENIVQFFNNFDSFLPEEALWQISEAIRPRGRGHRS